MQTICVSDKEGNFICRVITYDKKIYKMLFKQFKKLKQLNVYEEKKGE